ncbi:ferritin heavy chain-like [Culicoides brevitarsis]|uniref:ferritin heavy chain-like n=1 Tax=Culicoides brevitarsis TaxID=469753 RepID=UPI00307BECA1
MKIFVALFAVIAVAMADSPDYPSVFGDMRVPCISKTVEQIGCEVRASLEYLKFGAYWSLDNTNRPGFAKFFFESASEEREHAIKLIEYMNMRGAHHPGAANKIDTLKELEPLLKHAKECKIFDGLKDVCTVSFSDYGLNGTTAFQCALKMEMAVTEHIKKVIKQCEHFDEDCKATPTGKCSDNDYHYVDYLTGEFLTEQYEGQRKIAGYLKTLEKMSQTHGNIGEFFFDKTLLE